MIHPVRVLSGWSTRRKDHAVAVLLAVAAYLPMILTEPGKVSADTKSYLTLDPGAVLRSAPSMWDPSVGLGTVPHQNIGYLFPLGPYYWLMERIGVADWLTQRLLWGTLIFAAAFGLYRLARWLGWSPVAAVVAAFAYGFSPYLLSYLARLSVILSPWAALPWMILLAAKAARTRSWRPAAQFAIVVALVGSVNATALVFAGLGPVIWLVAEIVSGRVRVVPVIAAAAKIGVLSAAVSLWWIVALRIQGSYGIPILRYTETYDAVAGASTPAELVRGLGYWFFYGGDRLDSWVGPSLPYIDQPLLIGLGFAIAGISLLGFLRPFRGRASAAVLLLVGLAVSAGASPVGRSTPYGKLFGWFASDTTAGLALRSTPRAAPLIILALALGLGASSEWLRERVRTDSRRRLDLVVPIGMLALLAVQMFPWFTGGVLTPSLLRDEHIPAYETELAAWLDRPGAPVDGPVYELPAADFANYRWGGTVDPVLPGLIERPYVARELVPHGGAGTADLLNALERRLPEGWFEPEALAPIAQLLGVRTIAVRNDLEHERYRLARPGQLWTDITGQFDDPDFAGPTISDHPVIAVLDERALAHPDAAREFPAVAAFDIDARAPVGTADASAPIILSGSGDGVVDLAGAGLLEPDRPLLYAATLDDLAAADDLRPEMIGERSWWVVSDTNRKQGRHWSTVSSNLGALESAGPLQLDADPGDNELELFANSLGPKTIAVHEGAVADVRASYYGNRIAYTPEDAPWFAIDGDPTTAWRAGVFDSTSALVWEVDLEERSAAPTFSLLQPITGATNRFITSVRVTLDDDIHFDVALDERSRSIPGQEISLPTSFQSMRIEILADNVGKLSSYGAQPGVGFAEITIPGVHDDRVVHVPGIDAFTHLDGAVLDTQRLTYLFTRQRIDPATANRTSPEQHLVRRFDVPQGRRFTLTGEARLSADASEATLADALGEPRQAIADRRLRGSPASRGASALDGDITTAWQTPFDEVLGAQLTIVDPDGPAEAIAVAWRDDGHHSIPRQLTVFDPDGQASVLTLPEVVPTDGTASATVPLPAPTIVAGVEISAVDDRTTPEYFSGLPQVLPVAIVELQLSGVPIVPVDERAPLDRTCRDDLLLLDGEPLAVRLTTGDRGDALARSELTIEACGPVRIDSGSHRLDAVPGSVTGFDIDRIVIDDDPTASVSESSESPPVQIESAASTHMDALLAASPEPTWLVLRQSWNAGWTATADGVDLGAPVLIDGFANGWVVPASNAEQRIVLKWAPQRSMNLALWFSLVAGLGVLALASVGRRHERDLRERVVGSPPITRSPRRWLATAICLVVTIGFLAGPWVALAAVAIHAGRSRWPWLPTVVVVSTIFATGVSITLLEWRFDFAADPDWPSRFGWTSTLVWIAVATSVVCAVLPDRRSPPPLSCSP